MKVLLVEDLQLPARIAEYILKSLSCDVDIARTGREAVDKVLNDAYDLVLMDLGLPDYDGFMVTERIRGECPDLPIYALSAHTDPVNKARALKSGMNGFLIKPLEKDEVNQVICAVA